MDVPKTQADDGRVKTVAAARIPVRRGRSSPGPLWQIREPDSILPASPGPSRLHGRWGYNASFSAASPSIK